MTAEGFNHLRDCRHGRMLFNINDKYIGRSLELYGEFSEPEITLLTKYLKPADTVVEVGANMGSHTVPLAQAVSGGGEVIAFEPQRLIFQTLCANLALNSISNVRVFPYAVGEAQGTLLVPELDPTLVNNFAALELGTHESGEQVAVVCLDDMEIPACRLLKIDVEGMELAVLKGAKDLIGRCKPVLYVENDRKPKSDELVSLIASLGYRLFWHRPWMYNPDNFRGNAQNVFEKIASFNMLCVADDSPVDEAMPPVPVPKGG
jgi:FkbM family methyltransferase